MEALNVGTLLLDQDLTIRKFTPAMAKVVRLAEQDVGRQIEDFSHWLGEQLIDEKSGLGPDASKQHL